MKLQRLGKLILLAAALLLPAMAEDAKPAPKPETKVSETKAPALPSLSAEDIQVLNSILGDLNLLQAQSEATAAKIETGQVRIAFFLSTLPEKYKMTDYRYDLKAGWVKKEAATATDKKTPPAK